MNFNIFLDLNVKFKCYFAQFKCDCNSIFPPISWLDFIKSTTEFDWLPTIRHFTFPRIKLIEFSCVAWPDAYQLDMTLFRLYCFPIVLVIWWQLSLIALPLPLTFEQHDVHRSHLNVTLFRLYWLTIVFFIICVVIIFN